MKNRDLFIIALALVVSIVVAFTTRYILRDGSEEAANVTKVMVASQELIVGKRLEKNSFRWQDWPNKSLQKNYLTQAQKKEAEDLVGSLIREHVNAGEPILRENLAGAKGGYLSAMINENLRAFSIPLDARSSISGKVLPDDFVDVIVAHRDQATKQYRAKTVVRRVRVLEINGNLDPNVTEEAGKTKPQGITLEVSPRQAELLAAALREGTPVISLHSMTSDKEEPVEEAAPVVQKVVKEAPVVPEKKSIDVIRGAETETVEMQG
ncbi:MAG: Flp pilus assembly protein CpaB [Alphaproteobacteria bacterium]|nr:Flp pilus assembly protein CpaB [Alphaproteobacteria bacterium]